MIRTNTQALKNAAQSLRRRMTEAEKLLWNSLRNRQLNGLKFKRQAPFDRFVVDFLNEDNKLIIELDGGYHNNQPEKDEERDAFFAALSYTVLRFTNDQVMNHADEVLSEILKHCSGDSLIPRPLLP